MTRSRVDENIAFGIRRNAAHFAQIDVIGECERIGGRIEGNLRYRILGGGWEPGQEPRGNQQWQQASHGAFSPDTLNYSYRALDVFAGIGCRMSFCTRQDSISPTMISFGLRQSIMWTTWNPPNSLLAWPNLPMIVPSNSSL